MGLSIKPVLAQAVIRILRPLIRVLMRNEISHGEFAELAKHAYIDVARAHFTLPGRKMTHSRVSVLTGLNRKEVVRLSQQSPDQIRPRKGTTNRATRVISGWLSDSDFLDQRRVPRPLSLDRQDPAGFHALAARYSGDITARAVLDELKHQQLVDVSADSNSVRLLQHGYIPHNDLQKQFEILGMCAGDLLETIAFNLEQDTGEPYFQRQLVYRHVAARTAAEFRDYSSRRASELLVDLNHWLNEHTDDVTETGANHTDRIGVGIYYYEDRNHNE